MARSIMLMMHWLNKEHMCSNVWRSQMNCFSLKAKVKVTMLLISLWAVCKEDWAGEKGIIQLEHPQLYWVIECRVRTMFFSTISTQFNGTLSLYYFLKEQCHFIFFLRYNVTSLLFYGIMLLCSFLKEQCHLFF